MPREKVRQAIAVNVVIVVVAAALALAFIAMVGPKGSGPWSRSTS
jgi:hypothetical protein